MYFDTVYEKDEVVFRGTPQETIKWLRKRDASIRQFYWIVRGGKGKSMELTCNDYLKWMRADN